MNPRRDVISTIVLAGAALMALLPLVVHDADTLNVLIFMLVSIVSGLAWNLVGGFAGQHSFGHAAFLGLGAYGTMLCYQKLGWSPWAGLAVGVGLSLLLALAVGGLCFRLRGAYFSLATIASAEVLRIVVTAWRDVTGGAEGVLLSQDKVPSLLFVPLDSKLAFYYVLLLLAGIAWISCRVVLQSRMGFYLVAIREDQDAAESLGIPSTAWKLAALLMSAALTATAGSLYALYLRYVDPATVLSLPRSVDMVLICILGGIGTLNGPVFGGVVVSLVNELFRRFLGSASVLVYGILVVLIILFMPQGLTEGLRRRLERFQS